MKNTKLKKRLISFVIGLIVTISFSIMSAVKLYSSEIVENISDKTLRIQIIANSDSEYDQNMKYLIRDDVEKTLKEICDGLKTKEAIRNAVENNIEAIKITAEKACLENNYDKKIDVSLGKMYFTKKESETEIFPSGVYDALRITIGDGKGHNWWNLLYPPEFDENVDCRNILSKSEYSLISCKSRNDKISLRFKVVDWCLKKADK